MLCSVAKMGVPFILLLSVLLPPLCKSQFSTGCTEEGALRLEDGSTIYEGRVQICRNGVWGTVCDDLWDNRAARVVCAQLGYQREDAVGRISAAFGPGDPTSPIHLDNVQCNGNEATLLQCRHSITHNCFHVEDAGVVCQPGNACEEGELRLADGTSTGEGRVEVCVNREWSTVCDDFWDSTDASVVCKQLGYSRFNAISLGLAHFGQGTGTIALDNVHCTGNELRLVDCPYNSQTVNCFHYEDASVRCNTTLACTEGEVRLIGGTTPNQGRVEICLNETWGTVCDDHWGNEDVRVVCRQLGYPTTGARTLPWFGAPGTGPIHMDNVACVGTETSLDQCAFDSHTSDCTHVEDAGAHCMVTPMCTEGAVRLVGTGSNETQGRVEVCLNQEWGTVCDDRWGDVDAGVVCSQLGFSRYNADGVGFARFGQGDSNQPIHLDEVSCTGQERTLLECGRRPHDCMHSEDAGVICNKTLLCNTGDIRLRGGANSMQGRVEICWNEGWGTICDSGWDNTDAQVVCRELGYSTRAVIARSDAYYGQGTGLVVLDRLSCTGTEARLADCTHGGYNNTQSICGHDDDAGVQCSAILCRNGEVRLVNGLSPYEGRVEVCWNEAWGTVCDDRWDQQDARVVCRQLGYLSTSQQVTSYSRAHFGRGQGQILLDDVDCNGAELNLTSCDRSGRIGVHNCVHGEDAGARCAQCTESSVRLVNGSAANEGRVEICYGGGWGTVCDDGWDTVDAAVVCRELGFHDRNVRVLPSSTYGEGSEDQPVALSNVACTSSDTRLFQCTHRNASTLTGCTHSRDVGIHCQTPVPGAPQNLQIVVTSSTAITLTWFHPPESQRYSTILHYTVNCSTTSSFAQDNTFRTSDNITLSVGLIRLHPYTTYLCCVAAVSEFGTGASHCRMTTTLVDAPSRPPKNLRGYATSSTSAQVFWTPPDEEYRNGIISEYHVDIMELNTNSLYGTFIITDSQLGVTALHPYYNYSFAVAAHTNAKGPASSGLVILTFQDVPSGPPQSVTVTPGSHNLTMSIEPPLPQHQNGIITGYDIIVTQASNGRTIETSSATTTVIVPSLTPYTLYFVNVKAKTVNGTGPASRSMDVSTLEAAPSRAPRNVGHTVTNTTTLTLSWRPPADRFHNGLIRGYKVNVTEVLTGNVLHLDTPTTQIAVPSLHPNYEYEYIVAAYTTSVGPYSSVNRVQMPEDAPSAPPQNVQVTVTSVTTASVTWTPPPLEHQNGVIISYDVVQVNLVTEIIHIFNTPSTSYTLSGLHANTPYRVFVLARTRVGYGPDSEEVGFETGTAIPSAAPERLSALALGSRIILMSWSPPPEGETNGAILGYIVLIEEGETDLQYMYTVGPDNSAYLATMLHPYYNYNCSVAAYNSAGSGPFATPVLVRTAEDVPTSYPTNIIATADSPYSVTITWDPPPPEHWNGIITNYTVNVSVNELDATPNDQHVVNSAPLVLTTRPYTTYMISVAASTVRGQGPFSTEQIVITPEDAPSHVPQNITELILSPTSFLLTWNPPPEDHHNGEIREYRVNITEVETGREFRLTTEETEITVIDLHPYYRYVCVVTAVTVDEGPYSANITARTHEDAPSSAPPGVVCNAVSSTAIRVTWNELPLPSRNGLVRGYTVRLVDVSSGVSTLTNSSTTQLTLTNLVPFHAYTCSVAAYTIALGPLSTAQPVTTHADAPSGSPQSFTAIASSPTTLHTTWSPPAAEDLNGPLLGYVVELIEIASGRNRTNLTSDTSLQWTSLRPHYTYQSRVAARTQAGRGPFTPYTTVTMPEAAPSGAPRSLTADVRSSEVVHISWLPPVEDERNGVIRRYHISLQENSTGRDWNLATIATEYLLDFLHPYYLYSVRVAAFTVDTGPYSEAVEFTTSEDVPGSPSNLSITTVNPRTIHMTWDPPPFNQRNGIILRYSINITTLADQREVHSSLSTSTSYTVDSLRPYTSYSCSVSAETSVGRGNYITQTTRLPEDAPEGPPLGFNGVPTSSRSIHLVWSPPASDLHNGMIRHYVVNTTEVESGLQRTVMVMDNAVMLTRLHPHYHYVCTVAAVTVATGPSATTTVQTLEDAPSAPPSGLNVTHTLPTSALLTWSPPSLDRHNGILTGYTVLVVGPAGSTHSFSISDGNATSFEITDLQPFTAYTFSVNARTAVGSGPQANVTSTTPQGAPASPPDITVRRLNPTDIEVNWVPLSPEESQGIVMSYLVRFRIIEGDPIGSSRRSRRNNDDLTTVVETSDPPPLVVSDLDPRIVYAIAIAARNGAGIGSYGPETIVGLYENSLFQLHMSGTISCNFWLSSDNNKKSTDIINYITDELESSCNCDLSAKHIARERLLCGDGSTDRVIFVGALIGTESVTSDNVLEQLQVLVKTEPIVLVQGVHLKIAPCVVKLEENAQPKCVPLNSPSTPPPTDGLIAEQGSGFPIYIGIAVGAFLLLICITTTLIIVIAVMRRRQRKRTTSVNRNMHHYTLGPRELMNTTNAGATSPSLSKAEDEKLKEAELETNLDVKSYDSYPYDDGHIYDEPVTRVLTRPPLPTPPDYKNVRTPSDAPPSYSSTVRFLDSTTPLPTSAVLDSFLSNGAASGQHQSSEYSELDTSTMSKLEYGNIGQRAEGAGACSSVPDTDAVDYSNVVTQAADPNPYSELQGITPAESSLDGANRDRNQGNGSGGDKSAESATTDGAKNGHVRAYDTPAERNSGYQPLNVSQRSSYGEYMEASPRHLHSVYDVPRRDSDDLINNPRPQQAAETPPTSSLAVAGSSVPGKEDYVNTTRQAISDMGEYVEMLSSPQRKQNDVNVPTKK